MRILASLILFISFSTLASATSQAGFSYQQLPVPQWVEQQKYQLPATTESAPVSYLLLDEQVNWLSGDYQGYTHIAMQANTAAGVEQASQYQVSFAPEYQQLIFHSILLTRNGVAKEQLGIADIRLVQREQEQERQIYNGYVTAMVLLSDMQPGDIVDIQYSLNGANPIYAGKRSAYFSLNWSVAVQQLNVRLLTEQDNLAFYSNNSEIKPVQRRIAQHSEYSLQQKQVAAVKAEDKYPPWFNPYQFIEFNEFGRWQDVVSWALPLYQFDEPLVDELQQLVKTWQRQASSKEEFVAQVVRYVQNDIRYFGIEIGLNSHQPYPPNTVFARKYGDCKDKTTLMIALLAEAGIDAYPALVSSASRGSIVNRLPGPTAFDHVITWLPLNGKDYWLDGTRSQQYGSLQQKGQQYFQQALLIKPGQTQLTTVPMPTTVDAILESNESYQLGAVGEPVSLTVHLSFQQYEAESFRNMLDQRGKKDYAAQLTRIYQQQYPGADLVAEPKITDDKASNHLQVEANFTIDSFWDTQAEQQELILFGDYLERYLQLPENTRRKMPLYVEPNAQALHRVHYKLASPISWQLTELELDIDNPAFSYQRHIDTSETSITITHQYASKADHVPAAQALDYIKALKKVREAVYYSVEIDKDEPNDTEGQQLRDRLKQLLKRSD